MTTRLSISELTSNALIALFGEDKRVFICSSSLLLECNDGRSVVSPSKTFKRFVLFSASSWIASLLTLPQKRSTN
jgi:hypothetical protein